MNNTWLLIVTPMHNEQDNVEGIAATLAAQTFRNFTWYIVDDGSTDGTAELLKELDIPGETHIVSKDNDGGLIGGSAYTSWRYGIARAFDDAAGRDYTHVMKLDADVRLAPDYLERIVNTVKDRVGVAGGVIQTAGMREQKFHVPGPVKLYSRAAMASLESLPSAIGFDVMDEVAVTESGFSVLVDPEAKFWLSRAIGASEGGIHGRFRNGRVCRWTGYDFFYFLLHAGRYVFRRPFGIGAVAMVHGFIRAGRGPYDPSLKAAHASLQRGKLRSAVRNPFSWFRKAYGI